MRFRSVISIVLGAVISLSLVDISAPSAGAVSASSVDSIYVRTKSACILRYSPGGDELARLPAQTRLLALDFDGQYWKVMYGSNVGFLMNIDITSSQSDRERIQELAELDARRLTALHDSLRVARSEKLRDFAEKRDAIMRERVWVSAATANVRLGPNTESEVVVTLSRDQVVYVQEHQSAWCRVVFDGPAWISSEDLMRAYSTIAKYEESFRFGWIHESLLSSRSPSERKVGRQVDAVVGRRRVFVDAHPELSQQEREAILSGRIVLGMSAEMVRVSIGEPRDINRSVGSWGVHEQWVYPGHVYMYIENGTLTSWQD